METNLASIVGNPLIEKIAMKQLKKVWKENGIKSIVISERNGEMVFTVYKEDIVALPKNDFLKIIDNEL